jgi:hypothetical protein
MADIAEAPLYEIIFRNPKDSNQWLRIKDVTVTSGNLIFQCCDENRRTYSKRLTSTSNIDIHPGGYGVVRAFPCQDALSTTPKGQFSVHTDATGNAVHHYEYPWSEVPKPQIPGVDEHKTQRVMFPDVLIVGSGPLGATYARKIIEEAESAKVMMVEMGAQYDPLSITSGTVLT